MAEVLYGVRLVKVAKIAAGEPNWHSILTPQQASWAYQTQAGSRVELRGGGRLLAAVEDDDELLGVDITFTDAAMDGPAWAIIDGGTWAASKYTPRALGVEPAGFQCKIYQARYGERSQHQSGEAGFVVFTFPFCKGVVANLTQQDRQFTAPQFTIKARDSKDDKGDLVRCYRWQLIDELEGDEEPEA